MSRGACYPRAHGADVLHLVLIAKAYRRSLDCLMITGLRALAGCAADAGDVSGLTFPSRVRRPVVSGTIQEFSALIGVGVGALATYLAGAATERTRWRRERSARWDDRRAQAYAEYAHAVKDVYVQCMPAYGLRRRRAGARAAYREALTDLERLTDDRTAKWEAVLLLGDPDAIKAGRTWHRRLWQVERFARGLRTETEHWKALQDDIIADRHRFYAAARHDLGITSGDIPHAGPWESETD